MTVSAIVATAKNGVIGKDNQIPWHLPADLAWFKKNTLGHCVIMGRKSFHSIGRPLPQRTNIVVSRHAHFIAEGVLCARSVEEALGIAHDLGETEAFIIGGGEIYRRSIDFWDKIYLTAVDLDIEGDVFFPEIDCSEWREIFREHHPPDAKNPVPFTFVILERKLH